MRPVTLKGDPTKLSPHVEAIINRLIKKGEDPVKVLRQCVEYVELEIDDLTHTSSKKDWEIRQKDPTKIGTLANLNYLRDNLKLIIGIYQISKVFGNL